MSQFITTGTAGAATVDDTPVELIRAVPSRVNTHLMIINNGANAGFFKIGNDGEPVRIEKAIQAFDGIVIDNKQVFILRTPGGPNMTNVFGVVW